MRESSSLGQLPLQVATQSCHEPQLGLSPYITALRLMTKPSSYLVPCMESTMARGIMRPRHQSPSLRQLSCRLRRQLGVNLRVRV